MAISREALHAALFARLQSSATLCKTFKRRWLEPQQIGVDQQPALLCLEGSEVPKADPTVPTVWTLEATVVVYARTNDTETPGTVLSNVLDQIEDALKPQGGEWPFASKPHTTLGGLVQRAFIAGPIEKEDGALTGGQGWATLSIHMVVAAA